jgi:hypothetical protein
MSVIALQTIQDSTNTQPYEMAKPHESPNLMRNVDAVHIGLIVRVLTIFIAATHVDAKFRLVLT